MTLQPLPQLRPLSRMTTCSPRSSKNNIPTAASTTPASSANQNASKSRSVLSDILNLPSQTPSGRRKSKAVSGARVLTSLEACRMLEEKEQKKKDEIEEKERRKQEREQKKLQRQEQRKKQEERATKQAEKLKIAQEKAKQKVVSNKRRKPRESSSSSHPPNSKKKRNEKEGGCQGREASSNECAACFGLYEDDVDPETGDVVCEWI